MDKPRFKYGTQVYVLMGNLLYKGIVINQDISFMKSYAERKYLIKFLEEFKDGLSHGGWFNETQLSFMEE